MFDFDQIHDRRASDCYKWNRYPDDVLPLWVADMDFMSPPEVLKALEERVHHGLFGYGDPDPELTDLIVERLHQRYGWQVKPEHIIYQPGVGSALNTVCKAIGKAGDGVLVQTPVYPPFLSAVEYQDRRLLVNPLKPVVDERELRYEIDFDHFADLINDRTRLFMLCNPQNPSGRVFSQDELTRMADLCMAKGVVMCSDEIHCELLLGDRVHQPLAALSPEIAEHTITFMAPSKTFNLAGLRLSFAVVQNADLRKRLQRAARGLVASPDVLAYPAAKAAYASGGRWLEALLQYLRANRNHVTEFLRTALPELRSTVPEATFLTWIDCRNADIPGDPYRFFVDQARLALNDGQAFGPGGEGFVRLNFGCPRQTLDQALNRMYAALRR